jgi:hypothetical protein
LFDVQEICDALGPAVLGRERVVQAFWGEQAMNERAAEQYLGDGLYASFDGYMIVLRAPRELGDHWVGLEPPVFNELLRFALKHWQEPTLREAMHE